MARDSDTTGGAQPKGHTGGRPPVSSQRQALVRQLARAGKSRNAIAREVGISTGSVTKICAEAVPAISFNRAVTSAAVEAQQIDLKARRVELSELAVTEARRLFGLFSAPHMVIGWYEGTASEHEIDRPTSGDVKNYAVAIGILIDKHAALVKIDSDDRDLPAVDAWLAHVMGTSAPVPA